MLYSIFFGLIVSQKGDIIDIKMGVIMAVANHGWIYSAAKVYTDVIDTTIDCVSDTASAITSCTQAAISTACKSYDLGFSGTCQEIGKTMFGINDFRKAASAFPKQQDRVWTCGNRVMTELDQRNFANASEK